MNVAVVSVNTKGVIPQIQNRRGQNSPYNISVNNPLDSFESKTQKLNLTTPSFKGKIVANLLTKEGRLNVMDHFSVIKNHDPENTDKIESVKQFVIELIDRIQEKGLNVNLTLSNNGSNTLKSSYYSFSNANVGFFDKPKNNVFGDGEYLANLVQEVDLIDQGKELEKERYFSKELLKMAAASGMQGLKIRDIAKECLLSCLDEDAFTKNVGYRFSQYYEDGDQVQTIMQVVENRIFRYLNPDL